MGYGTTHKVNNLILQGSFENIESRHKSSSRKKKKFRGSFLPIVLGTCLQYCQKKRLGPSVLTFPENEASEFILDEANKRHFLWSLMRVCLFFFLFSIHYFASILKNLQLFINKLIHIDEMVFTKFQAGPASRYLHATTFLFWEQPLVNWIVLMLLRQKCPQCTRKNSRNLVLRYSWYLRLDSLLFLSFSPGYATDAKNCRIFGAFFNRLCIQSSNLFYWDEMKGESEI